MRNVWKALALAAVSSLTLAACANGGRDDGVATLGDGDQAAGTPSASSSVDPEDALAEFAECMRDNGIEDFADPQVDEDGRIQIGVGAGGDGGPASEADRQELADAMEACQDLLPRGEGPGQISEEDQAAFQDAMLEYAQCMRDHGIDMPDPDVSGGGGFIQQIGDGVDPNDPDFQAADSLVGGCSLPAVHLNRSDAGDRKDEEPGWGFNVVRLTVPATSQKDLRVS